MPRKGEVVCKGSWLDNGGTGAHTAATALWSGSGVLVPASLDAIPSGVASSGLCSVLGCFVESSLLFQICEEGKRGAWERRECFESRVKPYLRLKLRLRLTR